MPVNAVRPLATGADDTALAIRQFQGAVVEKFHTATKFFDNAGGVTYSVVTPGFGDDSQFLIDSETDEAEEFVPGTGEITGHGWATDEVIPTTDRILFHAGEVPEDQMNMAHWDIISKVATRNARKIAEKIDDRIAITLTKAARTAAVTKNGYVVHNGGNVVSRSGGDLATVYPVTVTGAKLFRDDATQLARLLEEDDVPPGNWIMYISPYIKQVLMQDTAIMDRDLTRVPADLNKRVVGMLSGFMLVETNRLPSTNITGATEQNTKYQGNFAFNGGVGRPAALVVAGAGEGKSPVVERRLRGLRSSMTWDERRHTWLGQSWIHTGFNVLHPFTAGEIRVAS